MVRSSRRYHGGDPTSSRQACAIDQLSGGRLVVGVGTGRDSARELSAFGEELDDGTRGAMLDEALDVVSALWSGDEVRHDGSHYVGRPCDVPAHTGPASPGRRCGFAGRWPTESRSSGRPATTATSRSIRGARAARRAGRRARGAAPVRGRQFEIVVEGWPGDDPAPWAAARATWWLVRFSPFDVDVAAVRGVIAGGPPA